MQEACRYCKRSQVVPVLDKEIEARPKPGNKYRRFCLSCHRWLPMCSEEYFREHSHPHVLPIEGDSVAAELIPLREYDYETEIAALAGSETLATETTSTRRITQNGPVGCGGLGEDLQAYPIEDRIRMSTAIVCELVTRGDISGNEASHYLAEKFIAWTGLQS